MAQEVVLGLSGGMNSDDSVSAVPSGQNGISLFETGDYRYAKNIRIGNTSLNNTGSGETIPSTLAITNYFVWNGSDWIAGSAQSGVNTALNKFEDRNEGKVYWAVHNSNGHHSILMFNKSSREIFELLQWDGLNFLLTNFVSMTKINKYLILTDGNPADETGNPPRVIDVASIYTLKYTLGNNFSEYHISLAKWLPVEPPILTKASSTPDGNVFIRKGIYQFAYRYIYIGGFKSCWSPPSNFISNELAASVNLHNQTPLHNLSFNFSIGAKGFIYDYNTPNNTAFQHSDPKFYEFVEFIEFGYRDSSIANWKMFSRLAVNNSIPPDHVVFENSGPITNIADVDIAQYFDSVPLLSRSVEAIDNRPMLGNNLDDLQPMPDFDVTNIEVYSVQPSDNNWFYNVTALSSQLSLQRFSFKESGVYKLGIIFKNYSGRSGLVQTLDKWSYTIPVNNKSTVLAQEDYHALGFKIAAGLIPPEWAVDYQIVRSNCLNIDFFIVGVINDYKFLTLDTNVTDNSLSTNDSIQTAISSYYDNNNTGGAAYSVISRILTAIRKNKVVPDITTCTLIYIDISNWVLDTLVLSGNPLNPSNNVYYNWQPGDRVRFWGSPDATWNTSTAWRQFDEEIIEYTGTSLIVNKPTELVTLKTRSLGGTTDQLFRPYTIEVYRPKKYSKDNDVIFYEMGEWYPILKPGTVDRSFSKTDFTWSGSSSVSTSTINGFTYYNKFPIINGDVWVVIKNFYYNHTTGFNGIGFVSLKRTSQIDSILDYPVFPQMNQDITNAAGFWEHNTGRPLVAYQYLPKQFEKSTQIRFGGKFLEDSLFIGINNFQDDNQKIYPSEYGKIRAMVNTSNTQVKDVGQILMVICEEETMDIYVNRATLQSLNGDTNVTLSDQVLGSYNTLIGSYGTLNPESVSKKNSRVLYWNAKRGMWIRRSTDGLTPISNVKMQNWFKDLSKLVIDTYTTNTPAKVLSVFDPYYEEWVTYLTHSSLPSTFRGYSSYRCASFNEDDKRWKSIYDYAPEVFAALENETYSIIGTVVHIHFAGTDYSSFYGVKKDVMWQPVANTGLRQTKVWRALNEQATDKWSIVATGDYLSNGGTTQQTEISIDDLEEKEGTFWSDIRRDENTVNTTNPIIEGSPMRGRALTLLLTLDPSVTWYSFINWLVVTFDLSEKTAKK